MGLCNTPSQHTHTPIGTKGIHDLTFFVPFVSLSNQVEGELHTARGEIARLDAEMKEATASQDARAASLDARLRSATQRALDADATIERLIGELEEERQK